MSNSNRINFMIKKKHMAIAVIAIATVSLIAPYQILAQNQTSTSSGARDALVATTQSSEASVSASSTGKYGDFNGDGFDDLAIGVYREDIENTVDAGAVNVLYGSASGLQTGSPEDQFVSQESLGVDDEAEANDNFGSVLAIGDFNGDGKDDLAIGVPDEDVGAGPIVDAGAVNVLYGSATGLQTSAPADQFWTQDSVDVDGTLGTFDRFGHALAAGDFNGDGKDDLAIGVPFEDVSPSAHNGAVNVLYGSATGLQTTAPADQFWTQDSAGVDDVAEGGDVFGNALAAGDFNGDGKDDLAIGVPYEDVGSPTIVDAGAVNVLYGSATGLQTSAPADQFWTQGSGGVDDTAEMQDFFGGHVLAAGDFNGDGKDDLAIGVPYEDVGASAIVNAGAVHILYGSATGLQTSAPADQFWTQGSGGVDDTAESGDQFGLALAAGDFNGNGKDDLAIGVPSEDVGASAIVNAGAVHVLYGMATGLQTSIPADQFWTQGSAGVDDVAEVGEFFGNALAAGDFNGNGKDDLAIGVPFEDFGIGAVHVLYGKATGLQTSIPADQFWTQDSAGVDGSAEGGDAFAFTLA